MAAKKTPKSEAAPEKPATRSKKAYLSQSEVPRYPLDDALRVANAISDQYGKKPTSPLDIAVALDMSPGRDRFGTCAALPSRMASPTVDPEPRRSV
jgi:hypothetical protein